MKNMGIRFIEHETMSLDGNSAPGSIQLRSAPLGFEYTGAYNYDGLLANIDLEGRYWSSTAWSSVSSAYYLGFTSSDVLPRNVYNRGVGFAVRCVGK